MTEGPPSFVRLPRPPGAPSVTKALADCTQAELEWAIYGLFADWLMLQRPMVRARMDGTDAELLAVAERALSDARAIAAYAHLEMPTLATVPRPPDA